MNVIIAAKFDKDLDFARVALRKDIYDIFP